MTLLRRQTNINNGLFGIVVMVAVQSAFRLEIHQNVVFFKKFIFNISTSKRSENIKIFILNKYKIKIKKNRLHRRIPKHADCPLK